MTDESAIAALRQEITGSGLFDPAWYLAAHPDVAAAGTDPLEHYVRFGMAERRPPNRYLDPDWYLTENPDIAGVGLDPVLHYLRHGDLEGRRPHPMVDPVWYRAAYELAPDTPALKHFLAARLGGHHVPCPELFAVPFLALYRDDPAAGTDPVAHFLDDMAAAEAEPFPDLMIVIGSGLVDPNYYLINASDVHEAQLDPAVHYCRFGWKEHRRPNIYFDLGWYLQTNPDLQRLRINPLVHYLLVGEPNGRRPIAYFDPLWYRDRYRVPAAQSALAHYLQHRRGQGVSPTPLFDVEWYVAQHADALGRNRDPFAHYLQVGTTQDVDPSPNFDAAAYRRRHLGRASRTFRHLAHPDKDNPLVHYLRTTYR